MKLLKVLNFFLIFICANQVMASVSMYEGEKKVDSYYGPLAPETLFNRTNGQLNFKDNYFNENYIVDLVGDDFFTLLHESTVEVPYGGACPVEELYQNKEYIRYLYRLIIISYLYEELIELSTIHSKLRSQDSSCSLNWNEVFASCRPKTSEMKKFKTRAKFVYLQNFDFRKLTPLRISELERWHNNFTKHLSNNDEDSLLKNRVNNFCKENGCEKNFSLDEIKKIVGKSCKQNKKEIQRVCNEEDTYFGVSKSNLILDLLADSNAIVTIDKKGYGRGCLERFQRVKAGSERDWKHLNSLFEFVYEEIKSKQNSYAQGSLFLSGALKEFDDKGLTDVIFKPVKKMKRVEPKPIVVVKPVPPKPKKKVTKIVAKMVEKPKAKKAKEIVEEKVPTEFESKLAKLKEQNLKEVSLDMTNFKEDFIFTPTMVDLIKDKANRLQTRAALKSMQNLDNLGTADWPLRLLFVKYFIDINNHKALFNIQAVLGKQFYVRNDIDGLKTPVFIELINNKETNNRWVIKILKDDSLNK